MKSYVEIMKMIWCGFVIYSGFCFSRVRRRWRRGGESIDGSMCLRCEEILVYLCMEEKA